MEQPILSCPQRSWWIGDRPSRSSLAISPGVVLAESLQWKTLRANDDGGSRTSALPRRVIALKGNTKDGCATQDQANELCLSRDSALREDRTQMRSHRVQTDSQCFGDFPHGKTFGEPVRDGSFGRR